MGNFDRQLVNALHKMHRSTMGTRVDPYCWWQYNGATDIYHCPHTAVFGKDLMERIPIAQHLNSPANEEAWAKRICSKYGEAPVNWIDLDSLIDIKSRIDEPRHQSDVKYLRKVKEMRG